MPGLQQMNADMGIQNPGFDMLESPAYRLSMIVYCAVTLAGAIALVVAGIGLLKLKPWGRSLSIIYGALRIVAVLVIQVVNYFVISQPMLDQMQGQMPAQIAPFMSVASAFSVIGVVIGCCFQMAYPVALLAVMLLPVVKAAFQQDQIAPLPPEYQPPPLP